jgi:hypothetical protein
MGFFKRWTGLINCTSASSSSDRPKPFAVKHQNKYSQLTCDLLVAQRARIAFEVRLHAVSRQTATVTEDLLTHTTAEGACKNPSTLRFVFMNNLQRVLAFQIGPFQFSAVGHGYVHFG